MKNIRIILFTFFICSLISSCQRKVEEDTSPHVQQTYSKFWKFNAGVGDSTWMNVDYDDSDWLEVSSNKTLKDQNISTGNGWGWYRKHITFSDSMQTAIKNKGCVMLHLGKFASCEEVFVNGKLIGKTGDFPPNYMGYIDYPRNYLVLGEDLNITGDNVIAIKFNEGWGIGGFLGGSCLEVSSAETNDKLLLNTQVNDSDYIFMGTKPISIDVKIENKNNWSIDGKLLVMLTTDDYKPIKTDSVIINLRYKQISNFPFEYKNPTPGFYRYTIQLKRNNEVVSENKFNVGYEPEKIQSPIDAKADFKEFWDKSLQELAKIKPNYKLILQAKESNDNYDLFLVEMYSFQNELIRGYYAKPKKGGKHPVIIEYMGYGSKPFIPSMDWDGTAHFVLSIRGQALNESSNHFGTWITYGLDSKENYYYRGAFLDVVRAIDFVCSRPELDSSRIGVKGGSQGGALSFVAAALDKRVKAAAPTIPFLSDYPDYFKIAKWPKSDFDFYMKEHPSATWDQIYNLLSYFDIKNLAQWIECPVLMGIGVQDEVCPPHINFAAYNQLKSEKRWMAFPRHGHSVGKEYFETSAIFFKEKLKIE